MTRVGFEPTTLQTKGDELPISHHAPYIHVCTYMYTYVFTCTQNVTLSATSLRPQGSLDLNDLIVPEAKTSMTATRAFDFIGTAPWNQLPPLTRSILFAGEPSVSFCSLNTTHFSLGLPH